MKIHLILEMEGAHLLLGTLCNEVVRLNQLRADRPAMAAEIDAHLVQVDRQRSNLEAMMTVPRDVPVIN